MPGIPTMMVPIEVIYRGSLSRRGYLVAQFASAIIGGQCANPKGKPRITDALANAGRIADEFLADPRNLAPEPTPEPEPAP